MSISFRQRHNLPSEADYFEMVTARNTPGVQDILKNATVGIAGLGGLGSNIAVHLARAGVGHMVLADFDVVDPSNLNRQNYYTRHIGMKKTEAIADVLFNINPYIQLKTHQTYLDQSNIRSLFSGVTVMVEAFDKAENKSLLIDEWTPLLSEIPLVCASGMAGIRPSNEIKTRKMGKNLYLVGDLTTDFESGEGIMSSRVILCAAHQSNAVIRLLLNHKEV